MSNLRLQDGPVMASKKEVSVLSEKTSGSWTQLYFYWINENNPVIIRRLALRTMLRADRCADILEVGGYGKNHRMEFYWLLKNRPVLCKEFREEFQYNLKHEAYSAHDQAALRSAFKVLLFLTAVVENKEARMLWEYTPYGAYDQNYDDMGDLIDLMCGAFRLPTWAYLGMWREIMRRLEPEADLVRSKLASAESEENLLTTDTTPQILALIGRLSNIYYAAEKPDTNAYLMLRDSVDWLNKNLSIECDYFTNSWPIIAGVTQRLASHSPETAKSYIERVLLYHQDKIARWFTLDFFYWLSGFIGHRYPDESKLINVINYRINLLAPKSCL